MFLHKLLIMNSFTLFVFKLYTFYTWLSNSFVDKSLRIVKLKILFLKTDKLSKKNKITKR